MSSVFEFDAVGRANAGTSSAKAIRRNGNIPAVVYGGSAEPELIELSHNEVTKRLANEAVYSHILKLNIDGKVQNAVLKDMSRHPAKDTIIHMDFMRVVMGEKFKTNVPLHFVNEEISPGVKEGGVVMHSMVDVEIECLPKDLPEYIEVDLSGLGIGDSIHLSDVVVPDGVSILLLAHDEDHDLSVVQVMKTRGASDEEGEGEALDAEVSEEGADNG